MYLYHNKMKDIHFMDINLYLFRPSGNTEVTVTREGDFVPNSPEVMEEINIFQGKLYIFFDITL